MKAPLSPRETWMQWYFDKAREPAPPLIRRLFWYDIKPGTSPKALASIAKGVLDIDDPHVVDWRNVRTFHLYVKRDNLSPRTVLSALSNMARISSRGIQRVMPSWFRYFTGWSKREVGKAVLEVTDEETFRLIVQEVTSGQPEDMQLGTAALFSIAYYLGLKTSQANGLRFEDLIMVDGKAYLAKVGRLIELPDHVRLPLAAWLRVRRAKKTADFYVFKPPQKRALAKYPTLYETHVSLKRMRA